MRLWAFVMFYDPFFPTANYQVEGLGVLVFNLSQFACEASLASSVSGNHTASSHYSASSWSFQFCICSFHCMHMTAAVCRKRKTQDLSEFTFQSVSSHSQKSLCLHTFFLLVLFSEWIFMNTSCVGFSNSQNRENKLFTIT